MDINENVLYVVIVIAVFIFNVVKNMMSGARETFKERKESPLGGTSDHPFDAPSPNSGIPVDPVGRTVENDWYELGKVMKNEQGKNDLKRQHRESIVLNMQKKQNGEERRDPLYNEGAAAVKSVSNHMDEDDYPSHEFSLKLNLNDSDELRKAFLYSEIMNRKYE